MDDISSLLTHLVQTKSIQRTLAPIAAQVSQLIIQNEAHEQGDKDAFPSDLLPHAQSVNKSSQGLVEVVQKIAVDSRDEILQHQMPKACELLSVAGENMITAAQQVHIEDFSKSSRRHLVRTAKDVLEGTLKVLMVSDDSQVRKIVKAGHVVTDRLSLLTAVKTMKNLVPAFKIFTESVMVFTTLSERRQADLLETKRREIILYSLTTLKKVTSMLSNSLQTYIKYPSNPQAQASREYAVGQVAESISDVITAIENKQINSDLDDVEEPGSFVTTVDQIIDRLSEEMRHEISNDDSDLDCIVESGIRHSMAVAHMSSEQYRNLIIKSCQMILKQRTEVKSLAKSVKDNPSFHQLADDYGRLCDQLVDEFRSLESLINTSVTHLLVLHLKETVEPLERLMKATLTPALNLSSGSHQSATHTQIDDLIDAFHTHSDNMCQVARFSAAGSADAKRVRSIRGCIHQLEKLDPEIVPGTLSCSENLDNRANIEHLRVLRKEWTNNVNTLVEALYCIVDRKQAMTISYSEQQNSVSQLKTVIKGDTSTMLNVTRSLIGLAKRFSHVTQMIVDQSTDPLYRNTITGYLTQLTKVITAVKSSASHVMEGRGDEEATLWQRCDILLKCTSRILYAIDGRSKQSVLDPARQNVRPVNGLRGLDEELDREMEEKEKMEKEKREEDFRAKMKQKSEEIKKKGIVKSYISDLTDNRISQLVRSLTTSAVAGKRKPVDLTCNDILVLANHVTDTGVQLAKCVQDDDKKKTLNEFSSEIMKLTPQMIEKAIKVVDCDTYAVEPMHQAAEQWAEKVMYLQTYLDNLLTKWKSVTDKVVAAAKMSNTKLLVAEVRHLQEHQKFVLELVTKAEELCTENTLDGVAGLEKCRLLRDYCDEVENLTTSINIAADVACNTDNKVETWQLETSSREWGTKVFCIVNTLQTIAGKAVTSTRHTPAEINFEDIVKVKKEIRTFTDDTMKLKQTVMNILSGPGLDVETAKGETILSKLDSLLTQMDECGGLLTHVTAPYLTTEKMYAPNKMALLQWEWTVKAEEVNQLLDSVIGEYAQPTEQLFRIVCTLKSGEDGQDQLQQGLQHFQHRFMNFKSKILDILQTSGNLELKNTIRRKLEELISISEELKSAAKALAGSQNKSDKEKFDSVKRKWATQSHMIAHLINQLEGTNKTLLQDTLKLMKGYPDPDKFPSSSLTHNIQSTNRQNTANQSHKSKSVSFSDGTLNGNSTQNLTGSLLDFADDLGGATLTDTVLTNHSTDDTLSASQNESRSNGHSSSHSYTPPVPPRPSPDKSWQELAQGPKVSHSSPVKPGPGSGYTPQRGSRPRVVSSSGYMFPNEAEKWEEDTNAIVTVANEMSKQLQDMADYTRATGPIQTKKQLSDTAKSIATNGAKLMKFAKILATYSIDERCAQNLKHYCDRVPTAMAQLSILASVRATSDEDGSSHKMLLKTAENLVHGVNSMLQAAESACIKGLKEPSSGDSDELEAVVLASQWKRKLDRYRWVESNTAVTDDLGLRRVDRQAVTPSLGKISKRK